MSQNEAETANVPVRIEMATSEIEGGSCVAWADPDRLVGIVANTLPRGAFEKYLLPNLITQDLVPEASAPALPTAARKLLAALENTHKRLYRENRSVMKDPNWIQVLCGVIEGQHLHLVGCGQAWAYVIRGGQAHLLESEEVGNAPAVEEETDDALPPALGRDSSLRLRVLTLDLGANDDLVLVTADEPPAPDLRAVANAFHRVQDLKRGCDGIVNLLAVHGSSGSSVAFRLIPVAQGAVNESRTEAGEEVLGELVAEVESMGEALDRPGETDSGSQEPPRASEAEGVEEAPPAAAATAPVTTGGWQPSYARGHSRRMPVLVWIVVAALVSLAGVVTLYRPGWTGLKEGIRDIWNGAAESANADLSTVESVPESPPPMGPSPGPSDPRPGGDGAEPPETSGTTTAAAPPPQPLAASTSAGLSPGEGLVRVHPRDTARRAQAWLESSDERRSLPADFTRPAGWTRVFYEDDDLALWSQEVLVEAGGTTHVRVHSPPTEDRAFVRVESFHKEEGTGFVPADGDSVFLDGDPAGSTPWEEEIPPGWHSLRVATATGQEAVEVFSIEEGQSRFFSPRLGLQAFSRFEHTSPGRVLLNGPILLSVRIEPPANETVRRPLLLVLLGEGAPEEIPLAPVDPTKGLYVGMVDPEHVRPNEGVRYCFSCETGGGTLSTSEIYELVPVRELTDRSTP